MCNSHTERERERQTEGVVESERVRERVIKREKEVE